MNRKWLHIPVEHTRRGPYELARTSARSASESSPARVLLAGALSLVLQSWNANGAEAISQALAVAERSFQIPAGDLADALDRFGEQSGLQVVYEASLVHNRHAEGVAGRMPISQALDRLLSSSSLQWRHLDAITVVVRASGGQIASSTDASSTSRHAPPVRGPADLIELDTIVTEAKAADLNAILPTEPVDSVFGFSKAVLDIPRSVSVLSEESMDAYGIRTALDVAKTAPGTYTAPIFGINGNVNLRGVTSDTYFRGVKRLENTQLFPSPITAMSRVEVVRGPPSPLYGPGKAGGYTNFVPKSARASTGKFLPRTGGELEVSTGSYDLKALSAEVGGPIALSDSSAGYYLYGSAEHSDTYYNNVPFEQYILQSSFDLQLSSRVRAEFGYMFQHWSGSELAGWNRVDQRLIDTGLYSAGELSVDMDVNHDGLISTAEVDSFGPLLRTFAQGTPSADVAGMLSDNWRVDDAALVQLDRRATGQSPEDEAQARVNLGYFDTIVDLENGGTLVNKLYYERLDRFKWTRSSAFGQDTHSRVMEAKLIYQQPTELFDSRLKLNLGVSGMHRYYDTVNLTGTKYHDLVNRPDISRPFSTRNRFAVPNLEPHLAPWNTGLESNYTTDGVGMVADATYGASNLVLGIRYDWVDIESSIPDFVLTTPGARENGTDDGLSWSASFSQALLPNVRPYVTYARQETLIYGIDGGIGLPIVDDAMNNVELREVGIKTSWLQDTLFASVSAYRQTRLSFSAETTQVPSTFSSGWELETRWVLGSRVNLSASATWQRSRYVPARVTTLMVSPATFGLDGNYYGGRLQMTFPAGHEFAHRSGYPDVVFNLNATYLITRSLALDFYVAYQDEAYAGRLCNVVLPKATALGAALAYETRRASFRFSVNNLTNELYFVPNSPDVTGELTAVPAPERSFRSSVTFKF